MNPAINALEKAAEGDSSAVLVLTVIELFPMNAPILADMSEVLQRMVQLQYKVDSSSKRFFDKIDESVDLMAKIDEALPKDGLHP